MSKFKKWFTYSALIFSVLYIFGVYLDVHKNIFVSNFFYSPVLLIVLIGSLLFTLLVIDIEYRREKRKQKHPSEGISYVSHKNFSVDVNLLREQLEHITEQDENVSISNVSVYEDKFEGRTTYLFDFLIFLKRNPSLALEPFTSKLNAQFNLVLEEKFGSDFPSEIHIRYANEKEPFPVIDVIDVPKENNEPIEIPENISHKPANNTSESPSSEQK